jgi:hypothetical protein
MTEDGRINGRLALAPTPILCHDEVELGKHFARYTLRPGVRSALLALSTAHVHLRTRSGYVRACTRARAHPAVQTIPADPNWIRRTHTDGYTELHARPRAHVHHAVYTTIIPHSRLIADKIPCPRASRLAPGTPRNFPRLLHRAHLRARARARSRLISQRARRGVPRSLGLSVALRRVPDEAPVNLVS